MKPLAAVLTLLPAAIAARASIPIPSTSHLPGNASDACGNITCAGRAGTAQILVSRGSTEAPGTGILGAVAAGIASACPGSVVAANPYPALLDPYVESEAEGVDSLARMALAYRACCAGADPSPRMVLLGYSQGAQVTADFLCGRSEAGFPASPAHAAAVADDVAAVVLMGDPSFVKDLPWDRGNASNVSYFPRLDNAACLPVADRMVSYCDAGDYFCDNGTSADALAIHEGYVREYGAQAVEYVVGKMGGCGA